MHKQLFSELMKMASEKVARGYYDDYGGGRGGRGGRGGAPSEYVSVGRHGATRAGIDPYFRRLQAQRMYESSPLQQHQMRREQQEMDRTSPTQQFATEGGLSAQDREQMAYHRGELKNYEVKTEESTKRLQDLAAAQNNAAAKAQALQERVNADPMARLAVAGRNPLGSALYNEYVAAKQEHQAATSAYNYGNKQHSDLIKHYEGKRNQSDQAVSTLHGKGESWQQKERDRMMGREDWREQQKRDAYQRNQEQFRTGRRGGDTGVNPVSPATQGAPVGPMNTPGPPGVSGLGGPSGPPPGASGAPPGGGAAPPAPLPPGAGPGGPPPGGGAPPPPGAGGPPPGPGVAAPAPPSDPVAAGPKPTPPGGPGAMAAAPKKKQMPPLGGSVRTAAAFMPPTTFDQLVEGAARNMFSNYLKLANAKLVLDLEMNQPRIKRASPESTVDLGEMFQHVGGPNSKTPAATPGSGAGSGTHITASALPPVPDRIAAFKAQQAEWKKLHGPPPGAGSQFFRSRSTVPGLK